MASLCGKIVKLAARPNVFVCNARAFAVKITMGDPLEHATGLEKRELLAQVAGNTDPYSLNVRKKGPGTKAQPNEVPSAFDARIVGCICEEESTSINWMWVHKGVPKRCECGQWYSLVHRDPL